MTKTDLPPYAAPAPTNPSTARVRRPRSSSTPSHAGDLLILVIVNVTVVFGMWLGHGGWAEITASRSGLFLGVAQLTGLYASLLALAGITIAARPAALERRVGLDRALGWHR